MFDALTDGGGGVKSISKNRLTKSPKNSQKQKAHMEKTSRFANETEKQEKLIMHRYEIAQERVTMTITADSMKIIEDSLIVFEKDEETVAIINGKDIKYILRIE
jgi:hypothetical protein